MVDLEDVYIVEKVWIKNRIDCCSGRINGVKVCVDTYVTARSPQLHEACTFYRILGDSSIWVSYENVSDS